MAEASGTRRHHDKLRGKVQQESDLRERFRFAILWISAEIIWGSDRTAALDPESLRRALEEHLESRVASKAIEIGIGEGGAQMIA